MVQGSTLVQEKLDQAAEILREQDVDLWLTLVRETSLTSDPSLDLIAGVYSAWQGAFLLSATGERIAIVGRFDAPSVELLGAYEVIPYDESIRPVLRDTVDRPRLARSRSTTRKATLPRTGSRTGFGAYCRTRSPTRRIRSASPRPRRL